MKKMFIRVCACVFALSAVAAAQDMRAGITPPPGYNASIAQTLGQTNFVRPDGTTVSLASMAGSMRSNPAMDNRHTDLLGTARSDGSNVHVTGGGTAIVPTSIMLRVMAEEPGTPEITEPPKTPQFSGSSFASQFGGAGNFNLRQGTFTSGGQQYTIRDGRHIFNAAGSLVGTMTGPGMMELPLVLTPEHP